MTYVLLYCRKHLFYILRFLFLVHYNVVTDHYLLSYTNTPKRWLLVWCPMLPKNLVMYTYFVVAIPIVPNPVDLRVKEDFTFTTASSLLIKLHTQKHFKQIHNALRITLLPYCRCSIGVLVLPLALLVLQITVLKKILLQTLPLLQCRLRLSSKLTS